VSLIDEVRADLLVQDSDALLPPLRRGQGLAVDDVVEVTPLASGRAVASARLADGRTLLVPLTHAGTWRRATPDDAMSMSALDAPEPLQVHRLRTCPTVDPLRERGIDVDMSNDVRIIDDRVVAKWQLFREPGSMAGPRMVAHLDAAGFAEMPDPIATVSWGEELVASFTAYLPGAEDGWEWMLQDVREHVNGRVPPPEWPQELGALTGRLHAAAAASTPVIPQPVTRGGLDDLARHFRALTHARVDAEMTAALDPWRSRFQDACALLESATDVEVMPLHGDLHPGQFLRWREGIVVSDFDGNPLLPSRERALPGPTAYDVAGLLRGLDHVAIAAARRADTPDAVDRGRAWARAARERALAAYEQVAGVPDIDRALLSAFESLSPLHEAVYAATYLPRWRYVPLTVLAGGW